jgi:SAM-dependent methyltransferase
MESGREDSERSEAPVVDGRFRRRYEACPLCEAKNFRKLTEHSCTEHQLYDPALPPTMTWCVCESCGHCFVDAYLTEAGRALVFKRTHGDQDPSVYLKKPKKVHKVYPIERHRIVAAKIVSRVNWVRAGCVPNGEKWLDVGFGNGSLLFTAWEWGYHPVGLDLREQSVKVLGSMGFEAHCADIVNYDAPARSVAVVSFANVLEHIPYPKAALRQAYSLLSDDGAIFVSTPNLQTIIWKYFDYIDSNMYWYEIEHCHNFSRQRLYELLTEIGFTPVDYQINDRYRTGMEVIATKWR